MSISFACWVIRDFLGDMGWWYVAKSVVVYWVVLWEWGEMFWWVLRFWSGRCEVSDVTMCWEMIGLWGGGSKFCCWVVRFFCDVSWGVMICWQERVGWLRCRFESERWCYGFVVAGVRCVMLWCIVRWLVCEVGVVLFLIELCVNKFCWLGGWWFLKWDLRT